jgi:hypothetical protein
MISNVSEFVSAGFLITREVPRPSYVSSELLPDRLISASGCIARFVPDRWCIEWTGDNDDDRIEAAAAFELDSSALARLSEWITPRFGAELRWPNIIVDLDTATTIAHTFLRNLLGVRVLELALHESMTGRFCQEAEPPPAQPGHAPNGRQGIHEVILIGNPPNSAGRVLGFEPLVSFGHSLSCSWLCNHLETAVDQSLNIRPNHNGLIETFDDARRCIEYISRDDVGAEPGLWLPWLIVDHTAAVQEDS